jgi:hypothetical protein
LSFLCVSVPLWLISEDMSFAELFESVVTRCPRPVRAMGYLHEVVGIRGRYKRCRAYWADHLERCQAAILRGAARCEQKRKAVILGGGLLHDVPVAELADMFREVILVDLVHPWASRRATRHLKNVRRVAADITGTMAEAYRLAWDADEPLPRSEPTLFLNDPEVDFTASVNLLSQLPCMPMAYLNSQGAHPKAKVEEYARDLIRAHMAYLDRLPGRVTLITDVERLKYTLLGQVVERRDLFFGVPWPKADEEWEWRLAPCPEADPRHHYYRRVIGVDWK